MQEKKKLVLSREDFSVISSHVKGGYRSIAFNSQEAEELEQEFKNATLVSSGQVPDNVVRLYSTVTIKEEKEGKTMHLTLVPPNEIDIKQKKISVLSPIGTALIGFQAGEKVSWRTPVGRKTFTILDVQNSVH